MPANLWLAVAVAVVVVGWFATACGFSTDLGSTLDSSPDSSVEATTATGAASTSAAEVNSPSSTIVDTGTNAACDDLVAATIGVVDSAALVETSGLAASQRHDGVVWAHNDSGQATAIHALGAGGTHLATFTLDGIDGVDIEDMAVAGSSIYLADIGDNDAKRSEIAVYRFEEPDPTVGGGAVGGGAVSGVEVIRLRYPDGSRDAEAFAVDPATGEFVIVEKAFGFGSGDALVGPTPATVYVTSPPAIGAVDPDTVFDLTAASTLAMDQLATVATGEAPAEAVFTKLGLEDVATGADIRADGGLIAIRTYASVWLFERLAGESVAVALTSTPCEAPTVVEEQGEAVAFLDGVGTGFVTVSEGRQPNWNLTLSQ